MKKIKKHIIPIITLIIFVAIMNSGELLKKPFGSGDNVVECINVMKKDVISESWNLAAVDFEKLRTAWEKVERRIQFSVERDEMNVIETNISRIQGAVAVKDKTFIIIELNELLGHWDALEE